MEHKRRNSLHVSCRRVCFKPLRIGAIFGASGVSLVPQEFFSSNHRNRYFVDFNALAMRPCFVE